ncbi:methyl-accepting chemotaxis protein [Mycobacteroides salmoniphilum]|uniref:methyl-accepting chemotaxis protein n=1 Tax=Mycobacteroides salmoniphilum TaxID=404941 RepID=UPI001F1C4DA8|nr:methyl-accepting chemotaxis protein [Mycobacteroides salmoniphilum]
MSGNDRSTEQLTAVSDCRDMAHSAAATQELPVRDLEQRGSVEIDTGRRLAAFAAGGVLVVGAVAALHNLYRSGDSAAELIGWAGLLLLGMTALGGGVKLAMWGAKPVTAVVSDGAKARLSEPLLALVASGAVIAGALGMWWVFRGGYASWWQHLTGERGWSLMPGVGQMLVAVLAGGALLTGGRYVTGLAKEALTDSGLLVERDPATGKRRAPEGLWHPGLVAALIAGGLGLVLLTAGITPRLYAWITGPDVLPAVAAITFVLLWAIGSNLGWWKGLGGLYNWATDASQKASAVASVVAVLMFSASGLGLGWFTPATVPQAHAACPPDCGGPGGSDGPPGGGQMFQPPSQGGPQMPDYQGGINQPPMDQNGSISIYNTQAPSISNNSANGSNGQQSSQQGWDQPAHGTQPPDYQNATPYTQGPGRPNPEYNPGSQGGQANPGSNAGSQGGQPNQGVQQPAQQPQQAPQNQPPQQNTGQEPNQQPQQSDQQKIDDLTRQLQEKQQQSGQDRQRADDLTKQLQQNKQNQKQQQSPKFPSKDKKKDDKDEQDRDKQSGDNDLAALLMGAVSTRRRKQDEQEQGPDTQALGQDASQAVQGLPGDVQTYVQSGQQIGQASGQAAQGFGSAAQAGASLASSAQSGAVNPQDAITLVQGVSQGIQGTADAINAGSQIVKTAQGEADQAAQAVGDANPQLKPQMQQLAQLNDQASQVTDLVGQGAQLTSQGAGAVNSVSSLGSGGVPNSGGTAEAMSGPASGATDAAAPVELMSGTVLQDVPGGAATDPTAASTFGAISPPGGYEQDKADLNAQIPGFPTISSGDLKAPTGGKLGAHMLSPAANANVNENYKGVSWPSAPADGTLAFPNRGLATGVGYGADGHPLGGISFPQKGGTDLGEFASTNTWLYDLSNPQNPQFKGQLPGISQGSFTYDDIGKQMVVVGNTGLNPSDSRAVWTAPAQPGDTPDKWISKLTQKDSVPFTSGGGDRENQILKLKDGSWLLLDAKNGGGVRGFLSNDPTTILSGTSARISQAPNLDQMPPLPPGAASWQQLSPDSAYGAALQADNTAPGQGGSIVARVSYWATALNAEGNPLVDGAGNQLYLPMTFLQTIQINQ